MQIDRMSLTIKIDLSELLENLSIPGCHGLESYDFRIEDVERLDSESLEVTIERND